MAKKKFNVKLSLVAEADLKNIYNYYSSEAGNEIANKIVNGLISEVSRLEKYGFYLGAKELNLPHLKREYRRLIYGNYKIIYSAYNNTIRVHRFFDSRQSPRRIRTK